MVRVYGRLFVPPQPQVTTSLARLTPQHAAIPLADSCHVAPTLAAVSWEADRSDGSTKERASLHQRSLPRSVKSLILSTTLYIRT